MAIVTLDQMKDQIGWTSDMGTADDAILQQKIDAAQNHLERYLGFVIEERFGGDDQDPVPPALVEAVSQLAAHWYEVREAAGDSLRPIPFGVIEIADGYREWLF